MFKVLLKVPRVFFVNTRGSSSGALIGPQVTRQLPHGHPCFNLVEVPPYSCSDFPSFDEFFVWCRACGFLKS